VSLWLGHANMHYVPRRTMSRPGVAPLAKGENGMRAGHSPYNVSLLLSRAMTPRTGPRQTLSLLQASIRSASISKLFSGMSNCFPASWIDHRRLSQGSIASPPASAELRRCQLGEARSWARNTSSTGPSFLTWPCSSQSTLLQKLRIIDWLCEASTRIRVCLSNSPMRFCAFSIKL
jgi:hypothetical protein